MMSKGDKLDRLFLMRREQRQGLRAPCAIVRFEQAIGQVRKLNRTIEQVMAYIHQDKPENENLYVDIEFKNGILVFFCNNASSKYLLDGWLRKHFRSMQHACSSPPRKVRTVYKCRSQHSECAAKIVPGTATGSVVSDDKHMLFGSGCQDSPPTTDGVG